MARDRLMGTWKGTPPVTMRHKQSWPLLIRSFKELQHADVGDDTLEPAARNPRHEPKLRSMGPVQEVFVFVFVFEFEFEFDCAAASGERESMMMRAVERGSRGFILSCRERQGEVEGFII